MAFDPKTAAPVAPNQGFDPGTAQPVTMGGEFKKGVKSGITALQQAGYGVVSLLADATGAEKVGEWALEGIKAKEEEAKADAPAIGSFEQIGSLSDAGNYAAAGLGQLVPFMVSSIASGGVGGAAGRVAGGAAAKEAAKRALVAGAGKEAAAAAAARAAGGAVTSGATAGLAANTIATESGLIQGDIYNDTGKTDPLTALAYGIPAGMLDVLPQLRAAKLATGAVKPKGFISEIASQAAGESATEAAQTAIERKAVEVAGGKEAFSPEGVSEIINAGIIGGLGGGVVGGGAKLASTISDRVEKERPPVVGPLSGAANTAIDSGATALERAAQEAAKVRATSAGAENMGDKPIPPNTPPGASAAPVAAPTVGVAAPAAPGATGPTGTPPTAPGMSADREAQVLAGMDAQAKRDVAAMRTFGPDNQPTPGVKVDKAPVEEPAAIGEAGPLADLSLQNRDRTRAASVAQMKAIAADPDFDRLGEAPTPDVGAPMASVAGNGDVIGEQDYGKSAVVTMADGSKIPVRYAVLEAKDVLPSHEADGTANDAYYSPQPGLVRALNNARTAGVRAAYAQGTAGTYKEKLVAASSSLGLDPRAVMAKQNPILVRLYDDEWNGRKDLGKISNAPAGLALSPAETAMNDARALDMTAFKVGESGEIDTPDNAPFLRGFVAGLPDNERGELMTADGRPTKRLAERVRAAMFARAFADPGLIAASVEETDPDLKNVLSALTVASPSFASIPEGSTLDVRGPLIAAVRFLQESRRKGITFDEALAQEDMFGRSPWTDRFARFIAQNIRSPKRMGVGLAAVADFVSQETANSATGDMFGGQPATLETLAPRVNNYIRGKYGDEARTFGGPADQPGTPGDDAGTAPAARRRGRQSGASARTQAEGAQPDLFGGQEVTPTRYNPNPDVNYDELYEEDAGENAKAEPADVSRGTPARAPQPEVIIASHGSEPHRDLIARRLASLLSGKDLTLEVGLEGSGEDGKITFDGGVVLADMNSRIEALKALEKCLLS